MKKIFTMIAAMLLICSMVSAKKAPLMVTTGDICSLLKTNAAMVVEFDYSHAMWEQEETYKEFCGDTYEERLENSVTAFVGAFNKESNALKATASGDAAYKMVVTVDNLERKQGMSMWGRMYIRIIGTINVYDTATNQLILTVDVKNHAGGEDFAPSDRLNKCFDSLAVEFVGLGNKCK